MKPTYFSCLKASSITAGLSDQDIDMLYSHSHVTSYGPGDTIIRQGEENNNLYIILDGEAVIYAQPKKRKKRFILHHIPPGELLGEARFIDKGRRSVSIDVPKQCTVLVISQETLCTEVLGDAYHKLFENMSKLAVRRLRETNRQNSKHHEEKLCEAKNRLHLGQTMIYLLFAMSIYTLALPFVKQLAAHSGGLAASSTLLVILTTSFFFLIRKTDLSLSEYGLTWNKPFATMFEALCYSLPLMAFMIALKFVLILHYQPNNTNLFSFRQTFYPAINYTTYFAYIGIYSLFVLPQEFIARGCLQTIFSHYLPRKNHNIWLPIILSNVLFAASHAHKSFLFAIITLIPGLFWGWLYNKQKSLLGVCVSHILLGTFAIFILGFEHVVR